MIKEYKTVSRSTSAEITERKSRFICSVSPAATEGAALTFIEEIRSRRRDATHNIYVYTTGIDSVASRCSDDGEPSGTAGMPAMEVINKLGLRNTALVVTRYFGGIKLGAPGLVRVYSKAVVAGIEAAGIVSMALCRKVKVTSSLALAGKISNLLKSHAVMPESVEYASNVTFYINVPAGNLESFKSAILDLTSDPESIEEIGWAYAPTNPDSIFLKLNKI